MINVWKNHLTNYEYKKIKLIIFPDNFDVLFKFNDMYIRKYRNNIGKIVWRMYNKENLYESCNYVSEKSIFPPYDWVIPDEPEFSAYIFSQFIEYEQNIKKLLNFWSIKNHLTFNKKAQKNVINIYITLNKKELPTELIIKILEYLTYAELFLYEYFNDC